MLAKAEVPLDAETKVSEAPQDHKQELRLWLRLLTCTNLVDTEIRRQLRQRFDTTLPRFDLLAQLERASEGMTLGEVSKRMMVSNGNITGLVERLVELGQIERWSLPQDRRVQIIRLTAAGREEFSRMAVEHEAWVAEMFAGLSANEINTLLKLLGKLKQSTSATI
ncbi:MAG: MarR family transcriptional regulator [Hyphomonadaceae bacterium]|nr:MarR family transcriptional regulator [Hyphomonadaceae bacterium]